jgi:hypothetical protein
VNPITKETYYVFINAYKLDGVTPKSDKRDMPYTGYRGLVMKERTPIQVGRSLHMVTSRDRDDIVHNQGLDGYFNTTTVQSIDIVDDIMSVTTENTIYKFQVKIREIG